MKQIKFYKSDFDHVFHLRRMHKYIEDTLNSIYPSSDQFKVFYSSYTEKLRSFESSFDLLYTQVKSFPPNVIYFPPESYASELGEKCFEELDDIGNLLDKNIQDLNLLCFFKDLHEDMFLDEIYY